MPLPVNIATGDPNHAGIHNAERGAINGAEATANAAVPQANGIRVQPYGTNVNTARPNAAIVWWKGSTGAGDPVNAITGDVIFKEA